MMYCVRCLNPINGLDAVRISSPMMVRMSIHTVCLIDLYKETVYEYPNLAIPRCESRILRRARAKRLKKKWQRTGNAMEASR